MKVSEYIKEKYNKEEMDKVSSESWQSGFECCYKLILEYESNK